MFVVFQVPYPGTVQTAPHECVFTDGSYVRPYARHFLNIFLSIHQVKHEDTAKVQGNLVTCWKLRSEKMSCLKTVVPECQL